MSVDSFVKRNCKSANDDERCLRVDHLNASKLSQLFIAQKWRLSRKIDIVRKERRELSNARIWYESRDEKINVWDRENKWVWARHWDVRKSESTRALTKKEFEISHSFILLYSSKRWNVCLSSSVELLKFSKLSQSMSSYHFMIVWVKLEFWRYFCRVSIFCSFVESR